MQVSNITSVRKWGGSTTDAILDPNSQIFRTPDVDGLIGFRLENGCAVVFGDPVCPYDQIKDLTQAFHTHCTKENLKVIYLIISEEFAHWLVKNNHCKSIIEYGEELVIDPHDDPRKKEGVYASLVRRKARHALRENVVIKEYIPYNELVQNEIISVGEKWLQARKGPQIHFSHVRSFDHCEGKRWIYAEKDGKIIAVVILNRLEKHEGWLLNHLMFIPEAPHGVPELLIVTALEMLANEDCNYVTFGTVPASHLGEMTGLGTLSTYIARSVYNLANLIYHLDGKKKFWDKFHPKSKKAYLSFRDPRIGLKELVALKKSLNATLKAS